MQKERRQYRRVILELDATCEIEGPPKLTFPTKIVDIAPEGICFLTEESIKKGTEISLTVDLADGEKVTLTAEVMWCNAPYKDKGYRTGVKIGDIEKEDLENFIRFYCKRLFTFLKSKKKILIIEDEKDMVELLTMELKQRQYEVVSAYDGEDGFSKYLSEWPDLIILDVMIPKLNGYEVCRKIRQERKDTKTPIIMLTAKAREEDKIMGSAVGAERYITKPFESEHLLKEIEKCIKSSKS